MFTAGGLETHFVICVSVVPGPLETAAEEAEDFGEGFTAARGRESARPDDDDVPSGRGQRLLIAPVARDIRPELARPEFAVGLWPRRFGAAVPVPEAAAHFDDGLPSRQDDVRPPRQALVAHAEPESLPEKERPDDLLGQSILPPDRRHDFRPFRLREFVHQITNTSSTAAPCSACMSQMDSLQSPTISLLSRIRYELLFENLKHPYNMFQCFSRICAGKPNSPRFFFDLFNQFAQLVVGH